MKYALIITIIFSFLLFSCDTENKDDKSTQDQQQEEKGETEDSIVYDPEPTEMPALKVRLPRHEGGWIDENLDNPVFHSKKVDSLVAISVAPDETDTNGPDYMIEYLTQQQVDNLSVNELIYYCLAYPSSYSQICAEFDFEESTDKPKICAYLPFDNAGVDMSEIQFGTLKERKEEVIKTLMNFIDEHPDRIHYSYLNLLVVFDAYEAIPLIAETASDLNLFNYTALLNFISRDGNDEEVNPLTRLSFYEELYGESSYQYGSRIVATAKIKKEIINLATETYNKNYGN